MEREVDLVRLRHITTHWQRNPPLHVAFARFLGIGSEQPARGGDAVHVRDDTDAIFNMLNGDPDG